MTEATDLSDEELRKLLKPTPTESDAISIVRTCFCSDSDEDPRTATIEIIRQLDSYDDCNFQISLNGKFFLLKIHNGVESADYLKYKDDYFASGNAKSVIHLQNAMLWTLQNAGIPTSAPDIKNGVPVKVHKISVADPSRSPTDLAVRLLAWIPGRPMSDIRLLAIEHFGSVGRMLGNMHTALDASFSSSFKSPSLIRAESNLVERKQRGKTDDVILNHIKDSSLRIPAQRFHQWDGKHTKELLSFIRYIPNEKRRRMVQSIIAEFDEKIMKTGIGDRLRKGVNHGDFNDANIMMDGDAISGVIDFGDSVESWRILDVSIAMAYAMLSTYGKSNRSISAAAAVLRGYNAVYPITDEERKHLVLLIACRLSCSVTLGAFSYHKNPANKYLLLHSEPAWQALELIWGYDEDRRGDMTSAVNNMFHQACLYTDSTSEIIGCSDLAMPDPAIPDLMQSVRLPSIFSNNKEHHHHKSVKRRRSSVVQQSCKPTITFVTGNDKKLEEVKRILGMEGTEAKFPFALKNKSMDLPELQGEALNVAREKCEAAAAELNGSVIVEDTSLCFNALNGMPGVFIKWFLDSCGLEGLNKMLEGFENKSAYAQTVVAFSLGPGHDPVMFEGRTTGKIVMPRGELLFGWDPIFEPDEGQGLTYAEMSKTSKDAISHRRRAFDSMRQYLDRNLEQVMAKLKEPTD